MSRTVTQAPARRRRAESPEPDASSAPTALQAMMAAGGNQAMVQLSETGGAEDADTAAARGGESEGGDMIAAVTDVVSSHYPHGTVSAGGRLGFTITVDLSELSAPYDLAELPGLWPIAIGDDIGTLAYTAREVVEGAIDGGRQTWKEVEMLAQSRGSQANDGSNYAAAGLGLGFTALDAVVTGYDGLGEGLGPEQAAEHLADGCQDADQTIFGLVESSVSVARALEGLYELNIPGSPTYLVRDGEEDAIISGKAAKLAEDVGRTRAVYDEAKRSFEGQSKVNDDHAIVAFISQEMGGVAPPNMNWVSIQRCIDDAEESVAAIDQKASIKDRIAAYEKALTDVEYAARSAMDLLEAVERWKEGCITGAQTAIATLKAIIKACADIITTLAAAPVGASLAAKYGLSAIAGGTLGGMAMGGANSIVGQVVDTGNVDVIKLGSDVAAGAIASQLSPKLLGKSGDLAKRFGFNEVAVDLAEKGLTPGVSGIMSGAIQDTVVELRGKEVTRDAFLQHVMTNFAKSYVLAGSKKSASYLPE